MIPMDTIEVTRIVSLSSEIEDGDFGKKPKLEPTTFLGGGKWERKGDMPSPRGNLAAAVVNGKIYVMGGYEDPPATMFQRVDEYDPLKETWTKKNDMLRPRLAFSASTVDGKIYIIGGGMFAGPAMSDVDEYNPVLNLWSKKARIPTPRRDFAAVVVDGKIYAIGGASGPPWRGLSTVEMYDPAVDKWTQKADMPTARLW